MPSSQYNSLMGVASSKSAPGVEVLEHEGKSATASDPKLSVKRDFFIRDENSRLFRDMQD